MEAQFQEIVNNLPPTQPWTQSGSPIVDGKYIERTTGEIKQLEPGELVTGGPPAIDVYWHNRTLTGRDDQFFGFSGASLLQVSEYLVRVGELLKTGKCKVHALNVTKYAVNIIITTALSNEDMKNALKECKLLGFEGNQPDIMGGA
ncbi:hypothetical protein NKR23_g321 [Pleurostoma richardsiae]|uniref:Uncharacterized protein n=1 Tax=Pleurostoma richardsiae TaxID=41990 RepID=A0AA38VXI7_9PEZI|nr:hypothetical protein NKR23_g321 [Pleurostoma richardsiae]